MSFAATHPILKKGNPLDMVVGHMAADNVRFESPFWATDHVQAQKTVCDVKCCWLATWSVADVPPGLLNSMEVADQHGKAPPHRARSVLPCIASDCSDVLGLLMLMPDIQGICDIAPQPNIT